MKALFCLFFATYRASIREYNLTASNFSRFLLFLSLLSLSDVANWLTHKISVFVISGTVDKSAIFVWVNPGTLY